MSAPQKVPPAPVLADAVFPKELFKLLADIGESAFQAARKNGLRVINVHGRAYVLGKDWISYLESQSQS
jgi:hypothetical protein